MRISEIMSKNVAMIKLETSLKDAADKMRAEDIGALPVTDGEKIRGMLTDRDIVIRGIAAGKDPSKTPAREAMTEKIRYVFEDDDISKAAEAMKDRRIRRLVVLNKDKRLVGLLSLGDLFREADDDAMAANVGKCVAEPSNAQSAKH